jgi:predicted dehydrogenase
VPRWSDDARTLLADPEIDAVYVATPPGSHLEYALACAEAGKPCYVEKPMGRNHAECQRMQAAFAAAGLPLFVAYYRRALPRFLKVKELLAAGGLGRVRHAHVVHDKRPEPADFDPLRRPWRLVPEQSGGGLFFDLASHTLDLLDFLLGPIDTVSGLADNLAGLYAPEDYVAGAFRFRSGAAGSGHWCFCAGAEREYVELAGENGLLRFSVFGNESLELERPAGRELIPAPNPAPIQQPLIQTVVDELTGRGACPSSGETASRTSWVMDRFLAGYRERRRGQAEAAFDS